MKPFNQINVIPFIDIMLVLLAIVLLTATFISKQQIELELPTADNSLSAEDNEKAISISIDAEQQFYFEEEALAQNSLQNKLDVLEPKTPIVLSVDKAVPFEKFIFIIDLLKGRHLDNLSIMVREP